MLLRRNARSQGAHACAGSRGMLPTMADRGDWRPIVPYAPTDADSIRKRCAIYTRKSTEHGLQQDFNSLKAQQAVCSAYIQSQQHRGWTEIDKQYEDAAQSGGTLDRPAIKALLADIERGKVDIVVVYKLDRLSRSLLDFVRLI